MWELREACFLSEGPFAATRPVVAGIVMEKLSHIVALA